MEIQSLLFWIFSIMGVAGGVGLILNRNPVYSALSLILNFFSIAGLYLTLQAEFLAIIQILVYAGAIMVLFLFVIMLLNLSEEPKQSPFSTTYVATAILAITFLVLMFISFQGVDTSGDFLSSDFAFNTTEMIGRLMMTAYIYPFEMVSVVLIASLVGAIVIAKKYNYDHQNIEA